MHADVPLVEAMDERDGWAQIAADMHGEDWLARRINRQGACFTALPEGSLRRGPGAGC